MSVASEILIDNPVLLPKHYENQAPVEDHYGTEMPRERHPIEQEPPSSTPFATRPVVEGQDECTEEQPAQVLDEASNAEAHQASATDTRYQDVEDIERQPGLESSHRSLVNHLHQDAAISPFDEHLPSPQFFNEAFEQYGLNSQHYESQTDAEEVTADFYEQHLINPDHTEPVQDLDGASIDQAHQAPGNDTQYQAAEDFGYIERQRSPHSFVNHPHQDATISPIDEFDFGEVPSTQFFDNAFKDFFSSSQHHELQTDAEDATANSYEQHLLDPDHTESFGNDPTVQGYLDLACRLNFRLPHEPVEDSDHFDARELLLPLVEERPLTPRLIHGLIYTLLPGPLRIFEVCSSALDPEPSPEESPAEDFVAIVRREGEDLPLLVLGVEIKKTLYILDSETVDLAPLRASWLIGPEWRTEHINPRCIEPHIESTLLSVWIAETCFQSRPLENVPSSRDLRLRFLVELLAPYQRDAVLEKCGIPSKHTESQHVDTRSKLARSETQNFKHGALLEALLQKPSEIKLERRLRILQCVDEIGSPHILDSLKLVCARKGGEQTSRAMEQPLFEKLFHIHIYLDKLESQSHLLVARERYIKYCYFETYLRALKALQEKKDNSTRERRRVSARKRTASFKEGISEELPSTPYTEEIHRIYGNFGPSGRKQKASDMVKDEICSKVATVHGGNQKRIRSNINKYIRQGNVLHLILQGGRSLDPGLLVLFPSFGADPPSLSTAEFREKLQELEEKALSQPIGLKDIDGLTIDEANWFGEVLQTRPELLQPVPKTVLGLISNSLTHDLDLQERDSDSFRDRPLQFFA
ncbi:hypothetical protein EJ02DRAFT_515697 [Clathrospora elynae]|uniref:Uncharacterized protein n=1 Tax=Clathrospora elynae TaxID=706981 RepID=A0A6A5S7S0_9PLEO|nr:hypothetical protein EJ02DRAFT_515697 [Clathrospora elynae]